MNVKEDSLSHRGKDFHSKQSSEVKQMLCLCMTPNLQRAAHGFGHWTSAN